MLGVSAYIRPHTHTDAGDGHTGHGDGIARRGTCGRARALGVPRSSDLDTTSGCTPLWGREAFTPTLQGEETAFRHVG